MIGRLLFSWAEMLANDPEPPSVLRTELRSEYLERRENYLEAIPEEYRVTAKWDKDTVFILSCNDFLRETKHSRTKVERNKEEFFRLVFHAEPSADWLVPEEKQK